MSEYKGWTNYQTWAVRMWIAKEEGVHDMWLEMAEPFLDGDRTNLLEFSQVIKERHEETMPTVTGWAAELLNGALSEVNWYEIAEDYLGATWDD